MKMQGHTILVTGGGTGIGRGLAEAFHARGNQVIVTGRRPEVLAQALAANPGMQSLVLDVQSPEAIAQAARALIAEHPTLNAVIHSAGIMRTEDLLEPGTDDADAIVATNLLGPIRLNNALLPHLVKQPSALVMTVTSGLAFVPGAITPTYCASKAAVHSYTLSLRYQLRDTAVDVLELVPPYVQTELTGAAHASDPNAMPLQAFIDEVMAILEAGPPNGEVCVERVKPLRNAEASGDFHAFVRRFNDRRSGAAARTYKGPAGA